MKTCPFCRMATIKALPKSNMTFKDFKNLVIQSADKLSFTATELDSVKQSFSAVGI